MIIFLYSFVYKKKMLAKRSKTSKKCIVALKFKTPLKDLYSKYEIVFSDRNVTSIEVDQVDKIDSLTFFDESRKLHKCMLSTIDFNNASE